MRVTPGWSAVVTSLARDECKAKYLYEKVYCARGDMENRIARFCAKAWVAQFYRLSPSPRSEFKSMTFSPSVIGSWSSAPKARGAVIEAGLLRRSTSGP